MKLEFHPSTAFDVNQAVSYYERQRPGLGSDLRGELDAALVRIVENPLSFPVFETLIRRCIVHRFPYSVLFRVQSDDTVRVLVVRHHKRRPQFGLGRR